MSHEKDLESDNEKTSVVQVDVDPDLVYADQFAQGNSWIAKVQRVAGKYNIEQRGIERVPEDERTDTNGVVNIGTMVRPFLSRACPGAHATTTSALSGSQRTWW